MPNAVISSAKGAIQKYWWLCIVFALLFTAVPVFTSGGSATSFSRSYSSSAALGIPTKVTTSDNESNDATDYSSFVIKAGKGIIEQDLSKRAVPHFGTNAESLSFSSPPYLDSFYRTPVNVPILSINVTGDNKKLVKEATDWALKETKNDLAGLFPGVSVNIYQQATAPTETVLTENKSGLSISRIILFAILGLCAGLIVGMFIEFINPRLRTRRDFVDILGIRGSLVSWPNKSEVKRNQQVSILGVSLASSVKEDSTKTIWVAGLGANAPSAEVYETITEIADNTMVTVKLIDDLLSNPKWVLKVAPQDSILLATRAGAAKPQELRDTRTLLSNINRDSISAALAR